MINTCIGERGLGNNIATLSLLTQIANTGEQINIFTYPESGVEALIHAYKLSNNIHITHINIPGDRSGVELINNTSDVGKTLSPYIKYYNRNTDIKNKKYIGVEFYNHNGATDVFAQICKLAKDLKYDVISFDSLGCNLTEKINFLNNHCAAVISYGDESGTAHLAHTLDIPCVILPSDIPRDNNSFDNKWDTTPQFSYMQMHLDTQTYFLQDVDIDRCTVLKVDQNLRTNIKLWLGKHGYIHTGPDVPNINEGNQLLKDRFAAMVDGNSQIKLKLVTHYEQDYELINRAKFYGT